VKSRCVLWLPQVGHEYCMTLFSSIRQCTADRGLGLRSPTYFLKLCDHYRSRSVVGFVAEAASRGIRYDKYFGIGKLSRHIVNPRLISFLRTKVISHRCNFLLAFLPATVF
jgi:hypothetical protein